MSTLLVLYFICPPLSPEGPPLPGFPLPQARASLSGEKRSPRTGLGPGQEVQTSAEEGMIFRKPQAGLSPVAFRPVLSPPGAGGWNHLRCRSFLPEGTAPPAGRCRDAPFLPQVGGSSPGSAGSQPWRQGLRCHAQRSQPPHLMRQWSPAALTATGPPGQAVFIHETVSVHYILWHLIKPFS